LLHETPVQIRSFVHNSIREVDVFRFLHAADLHLDSPLRNLGQYPGCPAESIRGASREAFKNLVKLAIAEKVAFVLIAGDLFDGDLTDYAACLFLNAEFRKLRDEGIDVFMIQGNHDAACVQTKHLRLPDNVHRLASDRVETKRIDAYEVAVHGQGFATRAVTENLALAYPDPVAGVFNVGLLHTCATVPDGHEPYAPCSIEDLVSKGYGYWALGHIHKARSLCEDPPIVFPGNIQGRHARETGAKGAVLVTVEGGRVTRREARSLDVMRWEVLRIDATGAKGEDDLIERSRDGLRGLADGSDGRTLAVRVEIAGACPAHDRLAGKHDRLAAEVRGQACEVGGGRLWVEKVAVRTRPERDDPSIEGPIRAVRDFLDRLRRDPTKLREIGTRELADLKKKLPRGWEDASGGAAIDSDGELGEALEHIGPELLAGLAGSSAEEPS
jgi:DNA repair protein SbcD/Mre11